jgi:hypothetical protein
LLELKLAKSWGLSRTFIAISYPSTVDVNVVPAAT